MFKAGHPEGFRYSWFCVHYRQHPQGVRWWVPRCYAATLPQWAGKLSVSMRQTHTPGEKLFVDYTGQTIPIIDGASGKIRQAQLFVAVLGASGARQGSCRRSHAANG